MPRSIGTCRDATDSRINSVSRSSFGKSSPFLKNILEWAVKRSSSNKTKNCFTPVFGSNAHGVIHVLRSKVDEFGTLTIWPLSDPDNVKCNTYIFKKIYSWQFGNKKKGKISYNSIIVFYWLKNKSIKCVERKKVTHLIFFFLEFWI